MIPLLLEADYSPNGWLGIMMGTRLYYDFSQVQDGALFSQRMNELFREVDSVLGSSRSGDSGSGCDRNGGGRSSVDVGNSSNANARRAGAASNSSVPNSETKTRASLYSGDHAKEPARPLPAPQLLATAAGAAGGRSTAVSTPAHTEGAAQTLFLQSPSHQPSRYPQQLQPQPQQYADDRTPASPAPRPHNNVRDLTILNEMLGPADEVFARLDRGSAEVDTRQLEACIADSFQRMNEADSTVKDFLQTMRLASELSQIVRDDDAFFIQCRSLFESTALNRKIASGGTKDTVAVEPGKRAATGGGSDGSAAAAATFVAGFFVGAATIVGFQIILKHVKHI